MQILGLDVSHYDEGINLSLIRAWCDFVIIKAYDGINMQKDHAFDAHYASAVNTKYPLIDAYMYLSCVNDKIKQAEEFYQIVKDKPNIKRLWVDLERTGNENVPHAKIGSRSQACYEYLKAKGTHEVGIYTSLSFIQEYMTSYPNYPPEHYWKWLVDKPLWLAAYIYPTNKRLSIDWQTFMNGWTPEKKYAMTAPKLKRGDVEVNNWAYWQFTGEYMELPGHAVAGNGKHQALDLNVFNGDEGDFKKLCTVNENIPEPLTLEQRIERIERHLGL